MLLDVDQVYIIGRQPPFRASSTAFNAVEQFELYHREFPQPSSARAKMLCIDQLIHAFHVSLMAVGPPAAANLIGGSLREVILLTASLKARAARLALARRMRAGVSC